MENIEFRSTLVDGTHHPVMIASLSLITILHRLPNNMLRDLHSLGLVVPLVHGRTEPSLQYIICGASTP